MTLSKSEKNLSAFKAFLLGAFASAIATTLTYPIQVVQTKSRVNKCLHRKIEGQIYRNTERQKNRKTERWRDGETEKERWREREMERQKVERQKDGKAENGKTKRHKINTLYFFLVAESSSIRFKSSVFVINNISFRMRLSPAQRQFL